jgi:hypothetical protein
MMPSYIEQLDVDRLLVQGQRDEAAGLRIIGRVLAWRLKGGPAPEGWVERHRFAFLHCLHGLEKSVMWGARITPREGGADVELCGVTLSVDDPLEDYWPSQVWDIDIVRRRWWYVHAALYPILWEIYIEWGKT